jgi:hypothetical protein
MISKAEKRREITRHSRLFTHGPIDGRSRSGRYLARCREELHRHLGDNPSPVQQALVERIAMIQLRLMLLDEKAASGASLTGSEERAYTSLSSALARMVRSLGMKAAAARPPSLAEYMAARAGAKDAAA